MLSGESSSAGLLSTLFNTGEFTLDRARGVIERSGGVHHLSRLTPEELSEVGQISFRAARRIEAAITLGRAVMMESTSKADPLRNSTEVFSYLHPRIGWPEEEEFWMLALDIRQRPVGLVQVAKGSTYEVNLTLASVFKHLIRSGAPRGICIHTHPSGDPHPSDTDLTLTDRILQTAEILGVEVVDHIILGQGEYCSLADKGYI